MANPATAPMQAAIAIFQLLFTTKDPLASVLVGNWNPLPYLDIPGRAGKRPTGFNAARYQAIP